MDLDEKLFHRFLDGELTDAESEVLEAQLRSGPEVRRAFFECVMLEEALRGEFRRLGVVPKAGRERPDERALRRHWRLSLAAAAAVLALVMALGFLFRTGDYRGTITASADCDYRVPGVAAEGHLDPGVPLEVERGVLTLELTPSTRVIVQGPAELQVLDRSGTVELRRGRAFFDVGPGGQGLEVKTPSATLRDIGTRFGVSVIDGREEVHVMDGVVEVRRDGRSLGVLGKGEAAAFHGERFVTIDYDPDGMLTRMPREAVLMRDRFDDEDGTRMTTRSAEVGGPWFGLEEIGGYRIPPEEVVRVGPSAVRGGVLDTSGGSRILWAPLDPRPEGEAVYLLRLHTRATHAETQPGNQLATEGAERVALTRGRQPTLGFGGRGSSDGHFWFIESGEESVVESSTHVPVSSDQHLLLRYDSRSGWAEMFREEGDGLTLVGRRQVPEGLSFDGVVVMNHERWGDVALDELRVDAVVYPAAAAGE